jgi:hypothetical protein
MAHLEPEQQQESWPRPLFHRLKIASRNMRVRLAFGYVFLVTVLLLTAGGIFQVALSNSIEREARALLNERWGGVRGYLTISEGRPIWVYEPGDSVQVEAVNRLRRRLLIADANGNLLEISDRFPLADLETREALRAAAVLAEPAFESRTDADGSQYLIRRGPFPHRDTLLVLALAQPLDGIHSESRTVIRWYFWSLPVLISLLGALAWQMAGRALLPLRQLSKAAEVVSSETLSLRISPRGAGDEVDANAASSVSSASPSTPRTNSAPPSPPSGASLRSLSSRPRQRKTIAPPSKRRWKTSNGCPRSSARCCCCHRPKAGRSRFSWSWWIWPRR